MKSRGVNATVVTFSLVIASHSGRPLDDILPYANEMTARDVEPSLLFLEELVCSIIGRRGWAADLAFVNTVPKAR